jgi:hypothetical protein
MAPPRLVLVGASGWYGRTLIHEYLSAYGAAAAGDLLLLASRKTTVEVNLGADTIRLPVESLEDIGAFPVEDYDALVWYAFILKNKLPLVGLEAYRTANDGIARRVFAALDAHPDLLPVFFSSGAALAYDACPAYLDDPYACLKIGYEAQLRGRGDCITFYPYATTGMYVPDHRSFAVASFIHQALNGDSIAIEAKVPVVRSYGSAHDFSRVLLALVERRGAPGVRTPDRIVPTTHTLELHQLAQEVKQALQRNVPICGAMQPGSTPSVYVAKDYTYGGLLSDLGLSPTTLSEQIIQMASGPAFRPGF